MRKRVTKASLCILHPMKPDAHAREALRTKYSAEHDPMARMELITELSRMDDAGTVAELLQMLAADKEPRVREQAVAIIGFLASTPRHVSKVCAALGVNYRRAEEGEKLRTLDVISNIPAPEAARVGGLDLEGGAERDRTVGSRRCGSKAGPARHNG